MDRPLVSCILITFNSAKFLPSFFKGLLDQKKKQHELRHEIRFELIVIDNNSSDETVSEIKKLLQGVDFFERVEWILNEQNLGYSGAAEQGVRAAKGEYILIANPDIVMESDYCVRLVERLEADAKIASVSGKLLRFDFARYFKSKKINDGKTHTIDSAGLVMSKSRRCVDRGQGLADTGQYDEIEEVFGVTGACPVYRRSALEAAAVGGHVFDPRFFMYKEDVDIAWRLRLVGYTNWYFPEAVAYHGRGTGAIERESLLSVAKNRKKLPAFTRQHSYRNERVMRLRNESVSNVVQHFAHILLREVQMFGWILLREPSLMRSLFEFITRIPKTLSERSELKRKTRVSAAHMRKWFT